MAVRVRWSSLFLVATGFGDTEAIEVVGLVGDGGVATTTPGEGPIKMMEIGRCITLEPWHN
ncbi:hypothetical protein SESBI_13348 [Sesbania bispinosa]|nr:hypothetical protein SESBI_13348 [Sesbania bispinosa]